MVARHGRRTYAPGNAWALAAWDATLPGHGTGTNNALQLPGA